MSKTKPRLVGGISYKEPGTGTAEIAISRGLASGKLDYVDLSEVELIRLIRDAATVLGVMAGRRERG